MTRSELMLSARLMLKADIAKVDMRANVQGKKFLC